MSDDRSVNPSRYDATMNDPESRTSPPSPFWRSGTLHILMSDLPIPPESARQLEEELKALIEPELQRDHTEASVPSEESIPISLLGLGLSANRAARLTHLVEACVRNRLAGSAMRK